MIDKNKIISESELPIPVPSTDEAWKAMLKKLEEDSSEPVPIVIGSKRAMGLIVIGILVLLMTLWLAWWLPKKNLTNDEKSIAGSVSGSNSNKASRDKTNQSSITDKNNTDKTQKSGGDIVNGKNDLNKTSTNNQENASQLELSDPKTNTRNKSSGIKTKKADKKSSGSNRNKLRPKVQADRSPNLLAEPTEDHLESSSINYSLISGGPISKPLFPKMKISVAAKDEPPPVQNSYWLMEAGLEWGLPVPFASARNIMDGPNGSFQPYRILLPGAWVRMEAGKYSMGLAVNPFYSGLLPGKPFEVYDSVSTSADTTHSYTETKNLNKLFGLSAAFEYNYNITDRWWIGAGIQASWWNNGLVALNSELKKVPLSGSPIITTHKDERPITDEEWNNFSKSQIGLTAQFFYRKKRWDAGMRFVLPFTPLAKQEGPSTPFRAEFLFRIKLNEWRIKQK